MQSFWFAIFFLLSCAPSSPLSYASTVSLGRRHLYEDEESALPPPLSPISPPFFPLESFAPPPPQPPPTTFAVFPTFPANISALVLPRSSKPHHASPTLLVPALSAVLAIAIALGLALFLYGRHRGQNSQFKDTRSSSTSSYDDEQSHITTNFNVAATTSPSQVFYIGSEESDHIIRTGGTCFVKPESPEIRPLPPLPPRSFQPNYEAEEDEDDDGEDEFYSPMASLPCSENSSPSHSRSSSSGWVSPARSFSIPMSPPQSSNPRYSDASNLQSPSPERLRVRKHNGNGSASLRMFSFWNQNIGFGFPRISSASTSPDRGTIRTPLSSLYSSVSNSPDGLFRKFFDSSPPIWNDFSRNVKSVLLSSHSASRRDFVINIGESSSRQSQAAIAPAPPPTRPPPLVPPSQPFVVQSDVKKLSFSELPTKHMHWDRLRSSSFKLDKEIVETLFIANSSNPEMKQRGPLSYNLPIQNQESKVLDPRKAQNIVTLLKLVNLTTKDVCQALLDGDCDALGAEFLECLSRLAPSKEEENKLKSYIDDSEIGAAERFLKELLHVPLVFKRVVALLFVSNFHSEIKHLRRSFSVVQAACEELRNSSMFSTLVEAILKTGNKMNARTNRCGDAHAFKLDTLLKLVEVKGLDARGSLLHFVVQEMIISEGTVSALNSTFKSIRNLNSELGNVKKSADIEYGALRSNVSKLYQGIRNVEELLLLSEESGSSVDQWLNFTERMARFLKTAAEEIVKIKIRESSTLSALEEVTEQFHGDSSKEGHTLRIFMIVRDFLSILDEVCNEMGGSFPA